MQLAIADFVGSMMSDAVSPINKYIKDIYAEIKTLRVEGFEPVDAKPSAFLSASRYLLRDSVARYRNFIKFIFNNDIDFATKILIKKETFKDVIIFSKVFLNIVTPEKAMELLNGGSILAHDIETNLNIPFVWLAKRHPLGDYSYDIYMSQKAFDIFSAEHTSLYKHVYQGSKAEPKQS